MLRVLLFAFFLAVVHVAVRAIRYFLVRRTSRHATGSSPREREPIRGGEVIDVDFTEHKTKRPAGRS